MQPGINNAELQVNRVTVNPEPNQVYYCPRCMSEWDWRLVYPFNGGYLCPECRTRVIPREEEPEKCQRCRVPVERRDCDKCAELSDLPPGTDSRL
jgi:hypothetical protein